MKLVECILKLKAKKKKIFIIVNSAEQNDKLYIIKRGNINYETNKL